MGVRVGNNYIVSFSVNPRMHDKIHKLPKGKRSHFLRRAVFNAMEYDELQRRQREINRRRHQEREALMNMIRYYVCRVKAIQATGIDLPDYKTWEMMILNFDYKSPEWTAVFDAIGELTPHIDGLDNALHAFVASVDGKRGYNEYEQD